MNKGNNTFKFKTNIKCGGCVAKITPFLNETEGIDSWDVDTTGADKILTVESDGINAQQIIEKIQQAGFKIELVS